MSEEISRRARLRDAAEALSPEAQTTSLADIREELRLLRAAVEGMEQVNRNGLAATRRAAKAR